MLQYIFIISLFIRFTLVLSSTDIIQNIDTAITSNILAKYGQQDTLSESNLKHLIETFISPQENNEHVDGGNRTGLLEACSSNGSTATCKKIISEKCLDESSMREVYSQPGLNISLKDVFPALGYHLQDSNCSDTATDPPSQRTTPHESVVWAYGMGFSVVMCIVSMVGGCMVPFMKMDLFRRILMYCIGLGVGTIASAGCLVLIPESLELTGADSPVPDYHYKLSVLLLGIFLLHILKRLKDNWLEARRVQEKRENSNDLEVHVIAPSENLQIVSIGELNQDASVLANGESVEPSGTSGDSKGTDTLKEDTKKEVASFSWMLLIGDAIHKCIDGVSVGAAFTESIYAGISVGIAIICEELPHELGDIALLLHAGMSVKKALLYNLLAVIPSFLGIALGIILGENTDATFWILALAGGMYIYVSFIDMLPEMGEQAKSAIEEGLEKAWVVLSLHSLGLFTGFMIIFLIAEFGAEMEKSLT